MVLVALEVVVGNGCGRGGGAAATAAGYCFQRCSGLLLLLLSSRRPHRPCGNASNF